MIERLVCMRQLTAELTDCEERELRDHRVTIFLDKLIGS